MALGLGKHGGVGTIEDTTARDMGEPGAARHGLGLVFGWLAVAAIAFPLGLACLQIAVSPGHLPLYLGGDQALIGLGTKAAAGWHQLLGPYDRFGWHHPGPAYFYLQALPSHALAPGQSEFFGSAAINAVAAVLAVATVWRRVGSRAALWSAVCIGYLAIALGPALLRLPWNPNAVILPLCLLAVLCAGGATGSLLCLLGSLLVGSYLVQTDVAMVPVVTALVVLSLLGHVLARRAGVARDGPRPLPRAAIVALAGVGSAVLVAMWVPPVLQQIRDHPGNLGLLWHFFTSGHSQHGVTPAAHAIGAVDSQLGFRSLDNGLPLPGSHYVALLLALAVAVAAVAVGVWRRQRFGLSLGVASLVGQVVSIVSATRVVGPIYGYLVLWEIALPVMAAIGLGVALLGDDTRQSVERTARWPSAASKTMTGISVALAGGAVAVAVTLGVNVAGLAQVSSLSASDVGQAWRLVEPRLSRSDMSVLVDIRSHDSWPLGAGLADQLTERGVRPTVPEAWVPIFGTGTATGHEAAVVALYQRGESPPTPPPGSSLLGTAGDTVVYFSDRGPGSH
ncbi:MAG TPA: hypothetical protein VH112_00915 [Acidimicrobiales bacterium]|nr:hypothetical protein [Acidimicrobiales bacterium]